MSYKPGNNGPCGGSSHVTVPAIRLCGRCYKKTIDLRYGRTYSIGIDGRLICRICCQNDHKKLEADYETQSRGCS